MLGLSVAYVSDSLGQTTVSQFQASHHYTMYRMKNWQLLLLQLRHGEWYRPMNINLSLTLSRSSIDNPIYTRMGIGLLDEPKFYSPLFSI